MKKVRLYKGGFKFQVQRVNDGAVTHRLPGAGQSRGILSGVCSGDGIQLALRVARQVGPFGHSIPWSCMHCSSSGSGRHGEVKEIAVERGQVTAVGFSTQHGVAQEFARAG